MPEKWTGYASGVNPQTNVAGPALARVDGKPTKREALDAILDALGDCDFAAVCLSRITLRGALASGQVALQSFEAALALQLRADAPEAYAAYLDGGKAAALAKLEHAA